MKTGKAKLVRGYDQNSNLSIFVDKDITMLSKDLVIKSIDTLPQEFTIDELIEKLIFIERVGEGLKQSGEGNVVSNVEVKKIISKWSE